MTPFLAYLASTGVCLSKVYSTSFVEEEKNTLLFQNWSGHPFSFFFLSLFSPPPRRTTVEETVPISVKA